MRIVIGILMGFFSALLICVISWFTLNFLGPTIGIFIFITFWFWWPISAWVMIRGTNSSLRVAMRGFLIGAIEWIVLIPAWLIATTFAWSNTIAAIGPNDETIFGASLGAGLGMILVMGFSITMSVICLILYFVTKNLSREMRPDRTIDNAA